MFERLLSKKLKLLQSINHVKQNNPFCSYHLLLLIIYEKEIESCNEELIYSYLAFGEIKSISNFKKSTHLRGYCYTIVIGEYGG